MMCSTATTPPGIAERPSPTETTPLIPLPGRYVFKACYVIINGGDDTVVVTKTPLASRLERLSSVLRLSLVCMLRHAQNAHFWLSVAATVSLWYFCFGHPLSQFWMLFFLFLFQVVAVVVFFFEWIARESNVSISILPDNGVMVVEKGFLFSRPYRVALRDIRYFRVAQENTVLNIAGCVRFRTTTVFVEAVTLGRTLLLAHGDESEIAAATKLCGSLNEYLTDCRDRLYIAGAPIPIIDSSDNHSIAIRTITQDCALLSEEPFDSHFEFHKGPHASLTWRRGPWAPDPYLVFFGILAVLWLCNQLLSCELSVLWQMVIHKKLILRSQLMHGIFLVMFPILFVLVSIRGCIGKETWHFNLDEVRYWNRWDFWGLPGVRCKLLDVDRVQLCRDNGETIQSLRAVERNGRDIIGGRRYGLRLVSKNYEELVQVDRLTEGEALHMAHQLRTKYPHMFQNGDTYDNMVLNVEDFYSLVP